MMTFTKSRSVALPLSLAVVLGTAGCNAEPESPSPTEPACEPRSTTDPARLNIASSAERYGAAPPCRAAIQFHIARNTTLHALDGKLRITDEEGQIESPVPLSVALEGSSGGMFRAEHVVDPVANYSCRQLEFTLEIERCLGEDGTAIHCPEVRVRPSDVLLRLEATGPDVDVCYGD